MSEHATQTHHSRTVHKPTPRTTEPTEKAACSECGKTAVGVDADGIEYCQECGVVLDDQPIERTEPSWTPRDERRTGPSTSHLWLQKGTTIGKAKGVSNSEVAKLTHYNNRLAYDEKSLLRGLREVRSLAAALDVPSSTAEQSAYLYRKAANANLLQGRSMDAIAAACVYIAARRNGPPLTFSGVATASPVSESDISTAYRTVLSELDLTMRPPEPQEFLPRIASRMGVPHSVQREAAQILATATEAGVHIGQSPPGVAGAAVYGAAKRADPDITQDDVADVAGVSPVTLSRQWQNLKDTLEDD
jgi:transcription initiation factor TFIIB